MTEKKTYYVNIYRGLAGACGSVYETRELADQMAGQGRIACKEVEIAPGEGLQCK
ncbi:MAG: hypothetical protein V4602_15060 [Pseudomonadota bacterium]